LTNSKKKHLGKKSLYKKEEEGEEIKILSLLVIPLKRKKLILNRILF